MVIVTMRIQTQTPDEDESRIFWKKIWGINKVTDKDAK